MGLMPVIQGIFCSYPDPNIMTNKYVIPLGKSTIPESAFNFRLQKKQVWRRYKYLDNYLLGLQSYATNYNLLTDYRYRYG